VADFHQGGVITTLHRLGRQDRGRLEDELRRFAPERPLALILPALASEMDGPALAGILEELKGADYVGQVVVTLGRAGREDFQRARRFFSRLPQPLVILHNDGPRLTALLEELARAGVSIGQEGKGRAVWLALGYVLAKGRSRCVALHDCDIVGYDRLLLGRLAYPLMNPRLDYQFCKGYYARVAGRMYGRVTRLFVLPLLRALRRVLGPLPLLEFLESFRYPLSGEFAMDLDLARLNRVPADWGLEVGVLSEVFRNLNPRRVCQVDLADSYEHKHQALSPADPGQGLARMCTEIGTTILRSLAADGVELTRGHLRALEAAYVRLAEDLVASYAADAALNGLAFERHQEELAVDTFLHGLARACHQFLEDPRGRSALSNWNRVRSAAPEILPRLVQAVEADNS